MTDRRDWRDLAACQDADDPDDWFPEGTQRTRGLEAETRARAVCAGCPVQEECLDLALAAPKAYDRFGIFGGLSADEREELRRDDASLFYEGDRFAYAWLIGGRLNSRRTHAEMEAWRESEPDAESA